MASYQDKFRCPMPNCGYIYNPVWGDKAGNIPPKTGFEELPPDWRCPQCWVSKQTFRPLGGK
ncbi:MAG: rubredoxin [Deltaproteobacteria bacterium]|nr:rubredoxin [Deltaproteobacteria bacterium]